MNKNLDNSRKPHNKRVKKLKKIIVATTISLLLFTTLLCVLAWIRVFQLENEIDKLIMKEEEVRVDSSSNLTYSNEYISDSETGVVVNPAIDSLYDYEYKNNNVYADEIRSYEDEVNYEGFKKIYLTFDDGPSVNTNHILDVLDEYGIKATFFVNGHEGFDAQYIRIVNEGHSIGMHSFTHVYKDVYKDLDSFADDLYMIQSYIEDVTGIKSTLYRFPGGSSNTVGRVPMSECIDYLNAKNITYFDWNVSSEDAVVGGASVNTIVNNVINQIIACDSDTVVVLLHDSGDKSTTVEALPIIIERIAHMDNVVLLPITDETLPVQHMLIKK